MKFSGVGYLPGAIGIPGVIQPPTNGGVKIWHEGDAPIPVAALEEIRVTARRDYLPAIIGGALLLYALTSKRKRGRR